VSDVRRVECDRCGQQEDSPQYGEGRGGHLIRPGGWEYVGSMNLCPECYASFREWGECKQPSEPSVTEAEAWEALEAAQAEALVAYETAVAPTRAAYEAAAAGARAKLEAASAEAWAAYEAALKEAE
jgi:hypothetical protein